MINEVQRRRDGKKVCRDDVNDYYVNKQRPSENLRMHITINSY